MTIFEGLGLDLKLFIAQLFNFGLVFLVLWRFLYRPLKNVVRERREKIQAGLDKSDSASRVLEQAEAEVSDTLKKARRESQEILQKAKEDAETIKVELLASAQKEADSLTVKAKASIAQEKQQALTEFRAEASDLVLAVARKVSLESLKDKESTELTKKALESQATSKSS